MCRTASAATGKPSLSSSGCSHGDSAPASWPTRRKRPKYGLSASLIASGSLTTVVSNHHLALVIHHANGGFVHANIQPSEEFHRAPPAFPNATSLPSRLLASHHSASPNSQPRP